MPPPPRPPDLDAYLLPRERLVAVVRWHPVQVLRPTLLAAGLLALLGWVAGGLPRHSVLAPWLPLVFLVIALWYAVVLVTWRRDRFVVTDRRLLIVSGLVQRKVAVMPLRKVTDLTFEQPLAGPLFAAYGWGTFVFESAGQDQAFHRVRHVPHPQELYQQLTEEIFGENGIYGRARPGPAAVRPLPGEDD